MQDRRLLSMVGPGILVAATGVGAGDLATAAFAGHRLGTAVLWAALLGAAMKYLLNEGIARWQLADRSTIPEACYRYFGSAFPILFLPYFLCWSFFVGLALVNACGAVFHALVPIHPDPVRAKIVFGIAHSLVGYALVRWGDFALFERIMGALVGMMAFAVMGAAAWLVDDWSAILAGIAIPTIPQFDAGGLGWTVALIGGVGGTVTILSYGYWLREEDRNGPEELPTCRIDLAIAYSVTGLFGASMVLIGSRSHIEPQSSVKAIVALADQMSDSLGPAGRLIFLLGGWGAVFTSLLGVWQSVPYLFADLVGMIRKSPESTQRQVVDRRSPAYQAYLLALTTVPLAGLWIDFARIQKWYAVVGAYFIPLLAFALLWLNGKRNPEPRLRNGPVSTLLLLVIIAFFVYAAATGKLSE